MNQHQQLTYLVLEGTDQILTIARHRSNILVGHGMSQLYGTECNGKGADCHDGVGTGVTDPVLGVEISSPALDGGCGGVGGGTSLLDSVKL